jgi:hypothetical protein
MYTIMGVTVELMSSINKEYTDELVNTANEYGNILWLMDENGKPTTPYLKVDEIDMKKFKQNNQ